jgi:UDP-2-acetamido-2,6-beta-L-arabino-hexul-4-ose reductase
MNILVTGSQGFIGKNLIAWLERKADVHVFQFDLSNTLQDLIDGLTVADLVFHLAGVNRPHSEDDFRTGNVDFTFQVCEHLLQDDRAVPLVLSSSVQAVLDNPYGMSKLQSESVVKDYAQRSRAYVAIYRLRNVFGKWCRPNYNSVVATFCYNIAHDLPINISDPNRELELIYIDDVVKYFGREVDFEKLGGINFQEVTPVYKVTLGRLAESIRDFCRMRETLQVPEFSDDFTRKLYGTYLSYLEDDDFSYLLDKRNDPRGCLAEFMKSPSLGQFFISRTEPGVTRGNHYHHTKTEKFLVVEGEAVIRFRPLQGEQIIEYHVKGKDFQVVDIPPGYTHSIENVGSDELVTLFWASEVFDLNNSDTYSLPVLPEEC